MINLLRTVRLHPDVMLPYTEESAALANKWYTVLATDASGSLLIGDRAETGPFVTNLRWISPRLVAEAGYENEDSSALEKIARALGSIQTVLENIDLRMSRAQ